MNSFINLKTAEKTLQFGPTKCKTMIVGKNLKNVINSGLLVDKWSVNYVENIQTGEAELVESYTGQTEIENVTEQKYLGFVLSSTGDNMANIREIKKKSIGIVRTTITKLNSLNLKQYYFECSIIMMNVMIRSSILYASDMYYQLKETELRQLERIEESYLRQVLNTTKGCPINQLYLSVGHYPARFEIQKMRLLYLKYILHENKESLLYKFFTLQLEMPSKGDWTSTCLKDLQELRIKETLDEIRMMSNPQFSKLVKERIKENAFKYLVGKQGSKGSEIIHADLSMSDYLLPTNNELTVTEKQDLFAMKTRMVWIPSNFPKPEEDYYCVCGLREDMRHIYNCEIMNNKQKPRHDYDKLFSGNIEEQIEVFRKFEINLERREIITNENFPCDPHEIHCPRQSIVFG